MKKIIPIVIAFAMLLCCFAGCGGGQDTDSLRVVCTVFPVYDWVRQLTAGVENVDLSLIADNGVDMHSYQPTTGDIVDITTCDVFVYVGGESEEWVEEVLAQRSNNDMVVIRLLDELGGHALELSAHDHECVYDEHIWLSLANAEVLCEQICERLCELDEDNAALYSSNLAAYTEQLSALYSEYSIAVDSTWPQILVFADRFPFRYLAADYGIEYYAAFDGCSAETEASFETVASLTDIVERMGLNCVLIIEGSDDSLARTIIDGTTTGDQTILTLNSMQSVTAAQIESGITYISIMEQNLEVLRQALGCE